MCSTKPDMQSLSPRPEPIAMENDPGGIRGAGCGCATTVRGGRSSMDGLRSKGDSEELTCMARLIHAL